MKKEYQFIKGFKDVKTLDQLKDRVFINALSFTDTIKHAALEIGTSERNVHRFLEEKDLTSFEVNILRKKFKSMNVKVKLRFKDENI